MMEEGGGLFCKELNEEAIVRRLPLQAQPKGVAPAVGNAGGADQTDTGVLMISDADTNQIMSDRNESLIDVGFLRIVNHAVTHGQSRQGNIAADAQFVI